MKAEKEAALTAMRKAVEDVRNLCLTLRRLASYEAADLRINDGRSSSSVLLRSAVADRMKLLARGKLGAASVQFSPDMLHIALFPLADMVSDLMVRSGRYPAPNPLLPSPPQASTERGSQRDRQTAGGKGGYADVVANGSSRRPLLWCLWCDNHAPKAGLPRALEDKHSTTHCPKDDMPLLCTQPLCQNMKPEPLRHKANGHICKIVHQAVRSTAQSLQADVAPIPPPPQGQHEGGRAMVSKGDGDTRAPPNGGFGGGH
uniref:Uncharacterized protein n=1 Tax=Chromera velia CCMP2878 TaxID=1169474 RepID=A0A0G4HB04_9ALVE|eukprot:Cvel_25721.t1-p1 / transcript=Cvel_25721.t1 / gene=Cvel_25721 / organism=Chromera_velia_CCMP2878 / gene_product=hypothetical protein / transcript_product=hypothetical protein / location=Cvel_scaffold2954:14176-14949(-) / protein_length=258 / sequence_SO=supercontig / SO=protein_coding / is_pseudo=false